MTGLLKPNQKSLETERKFSFFLFVVLYLRHTRYGIFRPVISSFFSKTFLDILAGHV